MLRPEESMEPFDLAIVGGGINGTGIARDPAGRGLRVLLVEQNDLASGTSSASTKLIHGGLRYLEHGWLRVVREALGRGGVVPGRGAALVPAMRFRRGAVCGGGRAGCAAPPPCCGSGCSSTTISAGAGSCRRPGPSVSPMIR